MKKIIVIGAGGHAKVVIEILKQNENFKIIGCTDPNLKKGELINDIPILGDDRILSNLISKGIDGAIVALGDNMLRCKLYNYIKIFKFELINAISSFTNISTSVELGKGIVIMPGVIVNTSSIVDDNVILNTGSTVDHDCHVYSHAHICPGSHVGGNVTIGEGAFIGIGCNIAPGVSVGNWAVIGAGSTVIKDIPEYSLAVGTPARVIRQIRVERIQRKYE